MRALEPLLRTLTRKDGWSNPAYSYANQVIAAIESILTNSHTKCNTAKRPLAAIEGDATGEGFLKSYIREDYATLLSTLDERHAIVFGRASSCTEPVLVRPNEASKSPSSSSSWTKFRSTNETESGETCSTTVTGMCWRWSGWSRLWKDWPESLHDAADSG